MVRTNNFLRSRTTTPSSVPDSPRSTGLRGGAAGAGSPLLRSAKTTHGSPIAYDSDDSLRVSQGSMVNDIVGIKTMLLKLKRVLQEVSVCCPSRFVFYCGILFVQDVAWFDVAFTISKNVLHLLFIPYPILRKPENLAQTFNHLTKWSNLKRNMFFVSAWKLKEFLVL